MDILVFKHHRHSSIFSVSTDSFAMPNLNPFGRGKIPYHRISAEYTDSSSLISAAKEELSEEGENEFMLNQQVFRPRRSTRWRGYICYFIVGILSLIIGIVLGETFRLEYQIDGYLGMFYTKPIACHKVTSIRHRFSPIQLLTFSSTFRSEPTLPQRRRLAAKRHLRPRPQQTHRSSLGLPDPRRPGLRRASHISKGDEERERLP
jgi:hypothetical protein